MPRSLEHDICSLTDTLGNYRFEFVRLFSISLQLLVVAIFQPCVDFDILLRGRVGAPAAFRRLDVQLANERVLSCKNKNAVTNEDDQ